jgi:hypothetical protein
MHVDRNLLHFCTRAAADGGSLWEPSSYEQPKLRAHRLPMLLLKPALDIPNGRARGPRNALWPVRAGLKRRVQLTPTRPSVPSLSAIRRPKGRPLHFLTAHTGTSDKKCDSSEHLLGVIGRVRVDFCTGLSRRFTPIPARDNGEQVFSVRRPRLGASHPFSLTIFQVAATSSGLSDRMFGTIFHSRDLHITSPKFTAD